MLIFRSHVVVGTSSTITCAFSIFYRLKKIREFTAEKWPGNNIPTFRKKSTASDELEELTDALTVTCAYSEVGLNRKAIRQHIIDVCNERRKNIREGRDYTKV